MWKGQWDEHINALFDKYEEKFGGDPDTYEGILYEAMDYEEFCGYIEECLNKNKEIPDIVK